MSIYDELAGAAAVTIPEGAVKKITRKADSVVIWEKPVLGTEIGTLAVGTKIKINVNGTARNFIIVHQGLPGSMYDSSCNGTWLLMEDIYEKRAWDSSNNNYANSDIHSYLNGTFVNLFDSDIKSVIKQVKLPYTNGTGSGGSLATGSSGISAKVFLLSYAEVMATTHIYANAEGAALSHFNGAAAADRVAYLNGTATLWWLRSPYTRYTSYAWLVGTSGAAGNSHVAGSDGVRPALVLPSTTLVDENNNVIVTGGSDNPQGEITFYVDGEVYTALQGMTWGEWVDSEYNTGGFIVKSSLISKEGDYRNIHTSRSYSPVSATDVIIENHTYYYAYYDPITPPVPEV